ncbi:MAG: hypothetical protein WCB74_19585 [Pseudolabrys sp.]
MRRNKKKMKALAPKSAAGILFCACLVFSFSADAFDLNGTWTTDDSNCNRVFVKKNNKISLTRNADVFGGGFIVEGNQIRGQARTRKITAARRKVAFCI